MTAKEYLWRVRDAEQELRQLEMEYKQARDDMLHLKAIEYDKERVSTSRIGDLSDAIAALEQYAEDVKAQWDRLIALRKAAKVLIDRVPDGRYRAILQGRYLYGQSWEQVAVGLGYTYRHVLWMHGKALQSFAVFGKFS